MARNIIRYENKENLEENGIITVVKYYRNRFQKSENKEFICSNCGNSHNHQHIYELQDKRIVGICYHCNKKIHNLNSSNPKFNKPNQK
ncbi:hypothetical protein ETU08_00590 [Apibacter muscae]|nr:hypothetical protein ETU08_00590 [Apibacter muscae]